MAILSANSDVNDLKDKVWLWRCEINYNKTKKWFYKSHIRKTLNLSTDADSSTDTTVGWTKNTQKPKKN